MPAVSRPTTADRFASVPPSWVTRDSGIVIPPLPREDRPETTQLARAPIVDRYPIIIGQNLNSAYLSSCYRQANIGWRYQLVDVLDELMEHDPDSRAPIRQRVFSVAFGRLTVHPPNLRPNHPDQKLAQEMADRFSEQVDSIPFLTQRIAQLNWAVVYGLAGQEILWNYAGPGDWQLEGLSNIRNRRLNYVDPMSWDLFVWDQGSVGPGMSFSPTQNGIYGLRVQDYPGKFIVHAPSLNSDYPTRDGEGRYIGTYMLLKRMVTRCSAQDFERVIRPWVIGYFNKDAGDDGKPPPAGKEDIGKLNEAIDAFGMGAMNAATLPNSVKVELLRAVAAMSATEFLSYLNRAIAKGMLGEAFTTEPGPNGNLATAQVAERKFLKLVRYDARCWCDSFEQGAAVPWTKLNYPGVNARILHPRVELAVDELPDPDKVMDLAVKATSINMPVDADKLGTQVSLPIVAANDLKARRTRAVSAGHGPTPPDPNDPNAQQDAVNEGVEKPRKGAKNEPAPEPGDEPNEE